MSCINCKTLKWFKTLYCSKVHGFRWEGQSRVQHRSEFMIFPQATELKRKSSPDRPALAKHETENDNKSVNAYRSTDMCSRRNAGRGGENVSLVLVPNWSNTALNRGINNTHRINYNYFIRSPTAGRVQVSWERLRSNDSDGKYLFSTRKSSAKT